MVGLMEKSMLASFFIALGVAVNLTLGPPFGPFLFSFGLLSVCMFEANLFTGKAGYWWRHQKIDLAKVLFWNIIWGWFFGWFIGMMNPELKEIALMKLEVGNPFVFIVKSFFCGSIMFICVDLFKRNLPFGIFLGVPLFIYCGFQHSIANAIMYGVTQFLPDIGALGMCAFGNLAGAIFISLLEDNYE